MEEQSLRSFGEAMFAQTSKGDAKIRWQRKSLVSAGMGQEKRGIEKALPSGWLGENSHTTRAKPKYYHLFLEEITMTEPKSLKVRIHFFEEVLGTSSNNPNIHSEYIASKSGDAMKIDEEIEAIGIADYIDKSMTVFPRDKEGNAIFWDYHFKGFFKDSAAALRKVTGSKCSKVKAYKKEIDGLLFVYPRRIPIHMPEGGCISSCERPLRAQTAQGERVALANSETVPAGSWVDIEIECMTDAMYDLALECLDYGKRRGIGQWRNSGKGRFTYEILS